MRPSRRDLFKAIPVAGLGTALTVASETHAQPASGVADRAYWLNVLDRVARPVLSNLAQGRLRALMPVEQKPGAGREAFSHLEAFGRSLCGIAPWLALERLEGSEKKLQASYIAWAQAALDRATDPKSPDFLNFSNGGQALVDSAFLAQAILRAPNVLWAPLGARVKAQLVAALASSRNAADPRTSNWVMFAAMVEAFLLHVGETTLQNRLEDNVRLMLGWYVGDGTYGDGEFFHWDYYNALVIQPMLVDVLHVLSRHDPRFRAPDAAVLARSTRYAEVQERLIAPDGSFPAFGRSITYRYGAFQTLAQMALLHALPGAVTPAQTRCALTAVIRRMTEANGTFDAAGWLTIGFCGHQPGLGEGYISTGSVYLCAAAFLPLGLSPQDAFWADPAVDWTSRKLWSGVDRSADHALSDARTVEVPNLAR